MTNTTAAQPLDLDKLEALAKAARDGIIRSHGWAGTVDGFDALRVDEQYLLAASPATILALIAQARAARPTAEAFTLYKAVNEMMAHLGAHGEIDARHDLVNAVMAALHGLDGGSVAQRVEDLTEKAFMPRGQATRLAVSEYCTCNEADDAAPSGNAKVVRLERMVDKLLSHCPDPECHTCGEVICPYGEPLHFHHDGCPACAQDEAIDSCAAQPVQAGVAVDREWIQRTWMECNQDLFVFTQAVQARATLAPVAAQQAAACSHVWSEKDGQTDIYGACEKCGMSFQRYIHTECP